MLSESLISSPVRCPLCLLQEEERTSTCHVLLENMNSHQKSVLKPLTDAAFVFFPSLLSRTPSADVLKISESRN